MGLWEKPADQQLEHMMLLMTQLLFRKYVNDVVDSVWMMLMTLAGQQVRA